MAGHDLRARPPSGRPDGSPGAALRGGATALSFGRAPAVRMLGAGGAALRRRGGRWRLRDWRLRTKLTAVLLVPLLLAGVLGALRVTELVGKAHDFAELARRIGFAQQLGLVLYDLQRERQQVAALLANGRVANPTGLQSQTQRVDTAVATMRTADLGAEIFPSAADGQGVSAREAALRQLSGLAALRQSTVAPSGALGDTSARSTVAGYSEIIVGLLDIHRSVLDGAPEPFARQADGVKALAVAKEQASWQHAVLLTGILSGSLPAEQQAALRTADARFDAAADELGQVVSSAQRDLYVNARAVVDRKRLLDAALDRAQRGAPLETFPADWNSAAAGTVETIRQGETSLLNELRTDTVSRSNRAWSEAFWSGAAVAVLLLLAVVLLVIVVRSLLRPLRTLRTAAFEVADRRLPEAVEQLRTDGAPSQTTVDPVPVHSREEVGQVARAFDTVHMQAVRLAAEQAQLRCSLSDIFLKLSGRSHALVERQLQLIAELRSKVYDPELGTSLVELDRLAARMRRHSENLLVLAGGTVRSDAEGPLAVLEVLRRAVSEVEQYQRVTTGPCPAATVAGPVVRDLARLIAELVDNAIDAAPQGTTVTLGGALVDNNSLLLEISDSGPGLAPDELQAINARLASAPVVDAPVSGQMGMLVVSGLAAQHGITVRLRPRQGDRGITATVLVSPSLVTVDLRVPMGVPTPATSPRSPDGAGLLGSTPDHASDVAPGVPAANKWSGTDTQLPLQVSVVDEAATADLFSPSSIEVVTSPASSARTAQEEWLELFGQHESDAERAPVIDPLDGSIPMAGSPGSGQQQEVREEIFEMVSAWFRERQAASESNPPSTTEPEWQSPLDEGWQAAQALRTPVDHELTHAGLPKRQPRARLVAGTDTPVLPTPAPAVPARTPDAVRARLSRYQRGLRVGRHARIDPDDIDPDDIDPDAATAVQPVWTETPQRPFEQ